MAVVAPVFAALAEILVSGKSREQVAQEFQLGLQELSTAFHSVAAHLWAGKLARFLEDPNQYPERLPHYSRLASLEFHYTTLMSHWRRAEENCQELRAQEKSDLKPDLKLKMRADAFSFRVHQAAAKILREMQKAEASLQKLITAQSKQEAADLEIEWREANPFPPSGFAAAPRASRAADSQPMQPPLSSNHPASQENAAIDLPPTEIDTDSGADLDAQFLALPTLDFDPDAPTPQEFLAVLKKHILRIHATPESERYALVNALVREERSAQLVA